MSSRKKGGKQRAAARGAAPSEQKTRSVAEVVAEINGQQQTPTQKQSVTDFMASKMSDEQAVDPRAFKLLVSYKRYRAVVISMVVVCFALIVVGMCLYSGKLIDETVQNTLFLASNALMIVMLVVVFARVRPIKADIRNWKRAEEAAEAQALKIATRQKKSKGAEPAAEGPQASRNPDEMLNLFDMRARRRRNRRVPPVPEYKHYRKIWYALIIVAVGIMLVALVMAHQDMSDVTVPVVILMCSYFIIAAAMYVERRKMKPIRDAYSKRMDRLEAKQARKAARNAGA